jgi:hypothetical protein
LPRRKIREELKFWRKSIREYWGRNVVAVEVVDDETALEAELEDSVFGDDEGGFDDGDNIERLEHRRH